MAAVARPPPSLCAPGRRQACPAPVRGTSRPQEAVAAATARPARRQQLGAAPAPPPPRPWPAACPRRSPSSRHARPRSYGQGGYAGGPADPRYQQQQQWDPDDDFPDQGGGRDGSSGAAAGQGEAAGWRGVLQRSDRAVLALGGALMRVPGLLCSLVDPRSQRSVWSDLRAFLAFAWTSLAELPPVLRELHYPRPGLIMQRMLWVLAAVACLVGWVVACDRLSALIPAFIGWSRAHPGWPRQMAAGLLAAARHRLGGAVG